MSLIVGFYENAIFVKSTNFKDDKIGPLVQIVIMRKWQI